MRNDKNSALPANAGRTWLDADDGQLFALLKQRKSQKQIANRMERTEEEVFARVAAYYLENANPKTNWQK